VPDVSQKIGVSFAVEGRAADDVARLNAVVSEQFNSEIRFGPDGNSRPHVTIALGTADPAVLDYVTELVDEAVETIEPFWMRFGLVARETATGRYILADAVLPASVRRWRSDLRTRIADCLIGQGRTTDDPHLTVAVVDGHNNTVDHLLTRTDIRIADYTVTHVDIAHAGPRGAKGDMIRRFALGNSVAPNTTA
jgi:2'-5' RNA ligase